VKNIFIPIVNAEWKVKLILFIVSSGIFGFYFRDTFAHMNSMLCSSDGDGMKNYYTTIYHTIKDRSLTEFSALNYPYQEHCVYTDCQPLLTFILKLLPFTHGYIAGIMHFLMLFSFIITPNILYSIFKLYKVNSFTSFFSALAITLIIPQLDRIGGHFGLSYGCMIPIVVYLISKFILQQKNKTLYQLAVFNCALFLLHPYFGLGTSIFTFLTLFLNGIKLQELRFFFKQITPSVVGGLVPILFFTLFMKLTDHHTGRTTEPLGMESGVASLESIFVPTFGPFIKFMERFIKVEHREWEGIAYVGLFPIVMIVTSILLFPFFIRRSEIKKIVIVLFVTGILLLFFSFGSHIQILKDLKVEINALKQFRSLGRFAWFFYFVAPIFSVIFLHQVLSSIKKQRLQQIALVLFPLLFFSFNIAEGHHYLKNRSANYLHAPNVFLKENLSQTEKELIAQLSKLNYTAILPIPYYCIGSEIYDRDGIETSYLAMLLSFHCEKPLFGGLLARTSVNEVKNVLDLFNGYKLHNIPEINNNETILVLKTHPEHLPSEARLIQRLKPYKTIGETTICLAKKADFNVDTSKDTTRLTFELRAPQQIIDTAGIYFVTTLNKKPFVASNIENYEKPLQIPKGKYQGDYVISFRYYYEKETSHGLNINFIQAKMLENAEDWVLIRPMRQVTGFYEGYDIFEKNISLDSTFGYNLLLQGPSKDQYHISHLMLRPTSQTIKYKDEAGKLYINNFPTAK
jgi:hypothetical protein